jgi:hypothetical protein
MSYTGNIYLFCLSKINMGATGGAGTDYSSTAHEFTLHFFVKTLNSNNNLHSAFK